MGTRNTLTLDEDNVARLERLRKQRDVSFKELVNDMLRRGLDDAEKPAEPRKPFRTGVYDPGQPFRDMTPKGMLAEMDLDYARKKGLVPE